MVTPAETFPTATQPCTAARVIDGAVATSITTRQVPLTSIRAMGHQANFKWPFVPVTNTTHHIVTILSINYTAKLRNLHGKQTAQAVHIQKHRIPTQFNPTSTHLATPTPGQGHNFRDIFNLQN